MSIDDEEFSEAQVPSEPPVPIPARAIRFCNTCGAPWQIEWDACQACARRIEHKITHLAKVDDEKGGILSAVWLYFALMAISMTSIVYLTVAGGNFTLTVELIVVGAMSLVIVVWCARSWTLIRALLARFPSFRWYAIAAACAVPTFVVAQVLVGTLRRFFEVRTINYFDPYAEQSHPLAVAVLLVCVQPAIFEELAFRGVIQSSLLKALGRHEAVFVSAGMFAILHLSVPSIPHLFLIGVTLGWLRSRTDSLYPGMVMHFTHNFLVLLSQHYGSLLPW